MARIPVHRLDIKNAFESLSPREKHYAHHMARAAWHGARIIMRQTSAEALDIYEFIIGLHAACDGDWNSLARRLVIDYNEIENFLEYAAKFLSNVGNYYGHGDQKFVPKIPSETLEKLSSISTNLSLLFRGIRSPLYSLPPYSLGYPGHLSQSSYYPESSTITKEEISLVSQALESPAVFPENTRIKKIIHNGSLPTYEIFQASTETDLPGSQRSFELPDKKGTIKIVGGDHRDELSLICECFQQATEFAANERQKLVLTKYIESCTSGSLYPYRDALREWVQDKAPQVEHIFGFVEPYRDPHGSRAEFEGLVAIPDLEETRLLTKLVENSATFIKRLPWATGIVTENDGKGPLEKSFFEPPDFSSIHSLAYCSSIIFPGINLPNYNDIRQESGCKNVIIANRMTAESKEGELSPFVDPAEAESFQKAKYPAYYWWVVLHELLGHGTGRMMMQEDKDTYNFDIGNPPINPLTGKPIETWYKPGQTWTGQFADLATTVDECRAELVGAYLMDDIELLALFGFTAETTITAAELTYNTYMQLGVDGLRGLQNYDIENEKWGQAHSRAHFAILKCLLDDGQGFMTIDCDPTSNKLIVRVDRTKLRSHGRPALEKMLLRLHIYRCTADVEACRTYYEGLSTVHGEYLEWRRIVLEKIPPKRLFVHANTFIEGDQVIVKEYEPTYRGIIDSWVERAV